MQFSLKWTLAAVAYVALAAAAMTAPHWALADLLWAVLLLSICYAVLLAIAARERLRVLSVGFALAATVGVGCLYFGSYRIPWGFDKGYPVGGNIRQVIHQYHTLVQRNPAQRLAVQMEPGYLAALRIQSANAIAIMTLGLVGSALGACAMRRAAQAC